MNPKSNEFKALLSAVRERYATAKRRVDYVTSSGCNYICSELDKILEDAYNYSARGAYALAYSIAVLVLQECGWLSSCADSSSGWLTDTVYRSEETVEPLEMTKRAVSRIVVNAYECNPEARRLRREHYGYRCLATP